jgi:hypothetical protein
MRARITCNCLDMGSGTDARMPRLNLTPKGKEILGSIICLFPPLEEELLNFAMKDQ